MTVAAARRLGWVRPLLVWLAITVPVVAQTVGDTRFSVDRGFFQAPFDVVVATTTAGATIRYTLDGSDPKTSSVRAEGPAPLTIRIDPDSTNNGLRRLTPAVTLRAYATLPGWTPSNVDTQTYVFVDHVLRQTRPSGVPTSFDCNMDPNVVNDARYRDRIRADLLSIPSVSVVTTPDHMFGSNGLLLASASSIEVPASIEVIYPDGRKGVHAACGIKPHSHILRKRSLRVYFREAVYGVGRLKHDLFAESEGADSRIRRFDTLVLRAGVNDNLQSNWDGRNGRATYVTDQLARSSQIAMSGMGVRGIFAHLYLNGLYWGLYNPSERADEGFTSSYFGGTKTDWFAMNHGGVLNGDSNWFYGLIGNARDWNVVRDRLDCESFADYILYYCYSGGGDWPQNNWYAGNRVLPRPGHVRFFVWDCEDSYIRMPGRANDGAWIHPNLLSGNSDISRLWTGADDHAEFRMSFADRVYRHCFNDGALTDQAVQRRFDQLCQTIDGAVVPESARWGRYKGGGGMWTRDGNWVPYRDSVRNLFNGNVQRLIAALRNVNVPVAHPPYYPSIDPPLFKSGPVVLTQTTLSVRAGTPVRIERDGTQGTVFATIDGTDPRAFGGAARGFGVGVAIDLPITQSMTICARTLHGSEWSALHRLELHVVDSLPIEIHEFMAENDNGIRDEAGETDDWIEIWNKGAVPFDLGGYHLTDDPSRPTRWRLPPNTIVPAGGTILIWADGQVGQGPLHANFALASAGEAVALFDPSGTVFIDGVQFGPQTADVSMGRLARGSRSWVLFSTPTPRQPNRATPCGHITYGPARAPRLPLTLFGEGSVVPGEAWTVRLRGTAPGNFVAFAIGVEPVEATLNGIGMLLVNPLAIVSMTADNGGEAILQLPLPAQKTLRGATLHLQAITLNGSQPVFTDAVVTRVCL